MKPADRGKTGSLATRVPPSLRGHLVGAVVGNFVGNFVDTFVSISVSISCTLLAFSGRFLGACQIFRGGFPAYETSVFCFLGIFVGHSLACQWGVSWPFGGLSLSETSCKLEFALGI